MRGSTIFGGRQLVNVLYNLRRLSFAVAWFRTEIGVVNEGRRLEFTLRLVMSGAVGLFGAAIVTARMEPEPAAIRMTSVDRSTTISLKNVNTADSGFSLLSFRTFQVEPMSLGSGNCIARRWF